MSVGASWPGDTPGRFTVTAGSYQLSGRRFIPPAPVPLFPADLTQAILGPGDTAPSYDWQRATVANSTMSVKVTKNAPGVLRLEAGRYWVVNTYGASLELAPCDGGEISDVELPTPQPVTTPSATTDTP